MIYFTADLHLGHENIIKYCNRPFKSIGQMDETIINNWNLIIRNNDDVYIIGDFAFKKSQEYAKRLNGNIYFIPGSHDKKLKVPWIVNGKWFLCKPIIEIEPENLLDEYGNKRLIVLCHWSMRSWNKSHYASWHLFGHHHGKLESYGLSFDVGVDTNNFFPYSLKDVERKMKALKPIIDFRGNKSQDY